MIVLPQCILLRDIQMWEGSSFAVRFSRDLELRNGLTTPSRDYLWQHHDPGKHLQVTMFSLLSSHYRFKRNAPALFITVIVCCR